MSNKLKPLWPLLTLFATSACVENTTAPVAVSEYCAIAKPISYDRLLDTKETVAEVEKHNSKWECVCNHDCPKEG